MSKSSRSASRNSEPVESFEERAAMLAEELAFAIQWQRPSILLAFYASETTRGQVEHRLQEQLAGTGQQLVRVTVDEENFDVPLLLARRPDRERSVYSVGGLGWGGGREGANAYRALNMRREFFVDYQIRAVFWLTGSEAAALPQHAPDFWAFRHRVIEFNDLPEYQAPAWQVDDFLDLAAVQPGPDGDPDVRIAGAEEALAGLPEETEALSMRLDLLYDLARLYRARREYSQAVKRLKLAIRLAGQTGEAEAPARFWNQLGGLYGELGEARRAVRAFRKALRLQPGQAGTWTDLGRTYLSQGRPDSALAAFRKAVRSAPEDPAAWTGLGRACSRLGRVEPAGEAFQAAARLAPGEATAWINLAYFCLDRGQVEQAREACQQAVRAAPESALAWTDLAQVAQIEQRIPDAIMMYRKALELDGQSLPPRTGLIACLRLAGRQAEADEQVRQAAAHLSGQSELARARFEAARGNAEAALDLLVIAVEKKQVGENGLRRDPNLLSLREEPRFVRLLETGQPGPA